ncbi:MAG: hypothetical protein EBY52_04770, partial [Actinobacteria bacterium]|nr:hypothetical protein [Actinomycetota bacterium]
GKTTHVGGGGRINDATYSLVDYNRAGVPLVEIVSRPDIRTVEHAKAYVSELRDILLAIKVSDAKMEEGSMRVDANVSVRPTGSDELRTRCELKNINSVRSLGRAIEYEARRHVDLYTSGEAPRQETRHWDEEGGRSTAGRSKEDADDYRYFQEPDLVPLAPTAAQIAEIDASMPVLPAARRARLGERSSVADEVIVTVVERGQDGLALGAIEAGADADKVLTRIQNDLAVDDWSAVTSESLAMLIQMETGGELTATQAKQVLGEMAAGEHGGDPKAIAAAHGFEAMESDELETLVDQLIVDHPDEWSRFVGGDDGDRNRVVAVEDRRGDEDHQDEHGDGHRGERHEATAAPEGEDNNREQNRQPHQRRLPVKVGIEVGVGCRLEAENDRVAGAEVRDAALKLGVDLRKNDE